jgi:hypothetical protein
MNETKIRKGTIMNRTTALALLGLACLMAVPNIAQARYRDGMNLYQYVRSNPIGHVDPSGLATTELERDIPDDCPKCPCVGDKHDCFIEVVQVALGTQVKANYTNSRGKRSWTSSTYSWVSNTLKKKKGRIFQERFPVIVRIKSRSGKDVRNCHLRQDAIERWTKTIAGTGKQIRPPVKKEDYSSRRSKRNLWYGGWWFHDAPSHYVETFRDEDKVAITHWFCQMEVTVEENRKIKAYWGGWVHADYDKKGADKDAVVKRKFFGPVAKKHANPFRTPATAPATKPSK